MQRRVLLLPSKAYYEVKVAKCRTFITSVNIVTSEQHVEMVEENLTIMTSTSIFQKAKPKKDMADTSELLNILTPRDPFQEDCDCYDS